MSADEQMAAIGRLVTEAKQARTEETLLRYKLNAISMGLHTAIEQIAHLTQGHQRDDFRKDLQSLPSAETVLFACDEFITASKRSKDLKSQVDGLGVL